MTDIIMYSIGPPVANQTRLVQVGKLGAENTKIQCPISGFPEPIVEWYKVSFQCYYFHTTT